MRWREVTPVPTFVSLLTSLQAAAVHELIELPQDGPTYRSQSAALAHDSRSILSRLDRIEAVLGLLNTAAQGSPAGYDSTSEPDDETAVALSKLSRAARHLRRITRPAQDASVWSVPVVRQLWSSYVG